MSAVKLEWIRAKNGRVAHARIGERKQFACKKSLFRNGDTCLTSNRCEKCARVIGFLEDIYGGAND